VYIEPGSHVPWLFYVLHGNSQVLIPILDFGFWIEKALLVEQFEGLIDRHQKSK
jgi:hypothetical protein